MTTFTLEQANTTLSTSGILLRLMPKGLDLLKANPGFIKAMQFCLTNSRAKQDVLSHLSQHKQNPELVVTVSDPRVISPVTAQPQQQAPVQQQQTAMSQAQSAPQQQHAPAKQAQSAQHHQQPVTHQAQNSNLTPHNEQSSSKHRVFDGHHVYGRNFALYFAIDFTKDEDATIAIDGAKAGAKAIAERKYNWQDKLRIQITRSDLPTVAAVLFGLLPKCELENYGVDHSKRLMIENQRDKFFLNMSGKDKPQIAVPISASDAFEVRGLILQQLLANRPAIGVDGVLANLKLHAMMLKPVVPNQP